MSPTLLVGDYFVADEWYYYDQPVEPGDVIVFTPPHTPDTHYVKRCVAVGRDTVEVREGVLFINNRRAAQALQGWRRSDEIMSAERTFPGMLTTKGNPDHFGPVVIPEGSYFLMGDTRDNSEDSRFFGPVGKSAIIAKVLYLYFSWDPEEKLPRFGRIGQEVK
jgi:signal peptidase I